MTSGDHDLLRNGHPPKKLYNPGSVLVNWAKNDADPTSGLGGVCETSHRHTDGLTLL